ncbi:hypothetical protein [Paenibacillus sp. KS-LC4]|uniref:WD40/YVTN/BNR-like repeat-containing protein n=1 Tax=Paenibacillus sp. KS-LC4 TaxID=2979727 RepID=UPI0030CBF6EC
MKTSTRPISKGKSMMAAAAIAIGLATILPTARAADTTAEQGLFSGKPAGDSAYHFSDIQFLNATTGRAAGNGFLIGTSDAGSHWQSIYKGTWQFTQLDFISNTTGWVLAKSASDGPNALLYTTDGGSKFTKLPTGNLQLQRIHFVDKNNGFGYTKAFAYKTKDGGKSWAKIATPANTRYAEFVNDKQGWVLVILPGLGYNLSRTTDGGVTWTTSLHVKADELSGGKIVADGTAVWAQFNGGAGMSQQSYSVYASANNGASWRKVISQSTAGGGSAPGEAKGLVSQGPASPGGHPSDLELVGGTAILSAYSPAAQRIGIGRSSNGGQTWFAPSDTVGYANTISFTSTYVGFMADTSLNSPAIYSTVDGGKSWYTKLEIPVKP